MIEILLLTIATLLSVIISGLGLTALLLPKSLRDDLLPISFWVGVIYLAISGTYLSQVGIATQQSWVVIVLLSLGLLFLAITKHKITLKVSRTGILIGILTAITLIVQLFTYLTKTKFLTTISMGNLDPVSYSTVADFLQKNTVRDGVIYQSFSPYLWSVGDLLHSSFRWGTPMVLSILSAAYGLRAYQLFGILITLFFGMSYPMLWVLLKRLRAKAGSLEAILLFAVYAINSTLMYALYNVFFAQFAWGGILILGVYLSTTKETNWLKALTIAGTALIYPEGIMFIVLPLLLLGQPDSLAMALAIAPYAIFTSLRQLLSVMINSSKVTWIGWEHIRIPNMFEMLGLYNLNYSRALPFYLLILPLCVISALMIWGWYRSQNRGVVITYLGVFGFAYLATLASNNWFTYFRAITYSIFLYAAIFTIAVSDFLAKVKQERFKILILLIVLSLTIRSGTRTAKQMYYHHQTVDKPLISLSEVPEGEQVIGTADLYLGEYNLWNRLWREYMMAGTPLLTTQNLTTDVGKIEKLDRMLVEKDRTRELSEKINLINKVWENNYYELYEVDIKPNQI